MAGRPATRIECSHCGKVFEQEGPGRRRKFCRTCLPSTKDVGAAAVTRKWRELTPNYSEQRRALRDLRREAGSALAALLQKIPDID